MRRPSRIPTPARRAGAAAVMLATSAVMAGCDWPRPPEVTIPPPVTWRSDATATGTYQVPVDGEVVDPFRAPAHPYGPGNRGIEYRTDPGSAVSAAQAGAVAFAGRVAGRSVVAIEHADGRRSTYTGLAEVQVARGERVVAGQRIGSAGPTLHVGVKVGDGYVDPARLFAPPEVVLLPDPPQGD